MAKYPLTYEKYKEIYSLVPRLTVELIIQSDEGILLTKRSIDPYVGMWHIPGGTVYYKETLTEAVNRVAKEELGIEVEIVRFIDFIHYDTMVKDVGWGWPIGAAYLCRIVGGEPTGSEQGEEVKFFRKIPSNLVPSQGEFLEKIC